MSHDRDGLDEPPQQGSGVHEGRGLDQPEQQPKPQGGSVAIPGAEPDANRAQLEESRRRPAARDRSTSRAGERSIEQGEQLAFVSERFLEVSGPIPHGSILKSIDDVVPGAAADIVRQAHENMRADRDNETRYAKAVIKMDFRGQWMAYSLTVAFGIASFILFMLGVNVGGVTFGVAALAPIVKAFLERGSSTSGKS